MKRNILITFLYFNPLLWGGALVMLDPAETSAQSAHIDSLYNQLRLHDKSDDALLNLFLAIAEAQELSNPIKGIAAADKAIELATKLNKEQDLANALNQKARLLIMLQLIEKANETLMQSIKINQKFDNKNQHAENDLTTAQIVFCQRKADSTFRYINKSYEHFSNSGNNFVLGKINLFYGLHYGFLNTDTAEMFFFKAKSYFEKCGRNDWLALTYFSAATNYTSLNNNDKAFEYFNLAENLNHSVASDFIAENIYCTKGYLYFSLADYPKALSNFIPGLKIAERITDETMQAYLLGNMGAVAGAMKDYKKSIEYINRSISIGKRINDGYILSTGYLALGWNEYETQNYIEALKYFHMALKAALDIKQFDSMAASYGAIGDANEKLGNYKEAFANIYKALELNRQQGNYNSISDNLLALSRTILNSGNNKLKDETGESFDTNEKREMAIKFSLEALRIAEMKSVLSQKRDALKQLSELYSLTGDDKKALAFFKQYVATKDTIMSEENIQSINNLQVKFETEKREQQIALLNTDKQIQEKEIGKRKTQRNGFIAGSILLLMIGGVAFNRYQVKKKANKQLSGALAQLKQVQQKLIEQEKLASLGQLTAGIAHEIQNPLNFVINFSQLSGGLFNDLKNNSDEQEQQEIVRDLEDNISKIEKHGKRADEIIKSMLMHSRSGEVNKQSTDLNALCREALSFSWQAVSIGHPGFICAQKIDFDKNLPPVNLVQQDISRVIINLLNNAFYAVQEKVNSSSKGNGTFKPEVTIQTAFNNSNVQLKISDNGNGIPEDVRSKIFQPFFTTKPTNLGTGLGLSISYDIVKAHGGSLILESTSNDGTVFILNLPV